MKCYMTAEIVFCRCDDHKISGGTFGGRARGERDMRYYFWGNRVRLQVHHCKNSGYKLVNDVLSKGFCVSIYPQFRLGLVWYGCTSDRESLSLWYGRSNDACQKQKATRVDSMHLVGIELYEGMKCCISLFPFP